MGFGNENRRAGLFFHACTIILLRKQIVTAKRDELEIEIALDAHWVGFGPQHAIAIALCSQNNNGQATDSNVFLFEIFLLHAKLPFAFIYLCKPSHTQNRTRESHLSRRKLFRLRQAS